MDTTPTATATCALPSYLQQSPLASQFRFKPFPASPHTPSSSTATLKSPPPLPTAAASALFTHDPAGGVPGAPKPVWHLPSAWSPDDKCTLLELKQSYLTVEYTGPGRTDTDAASVRANHPIPVQTGLYYFEVEVVSKGRDGYIGIGVCGPEVPLNRLPGWDPLSWGYHGDDGHKFQCSGTGKPFGPKFTTGDLLGCGVHFSQRSIFYTRNGAMIGTAFTDVPMGGSTGGPQQHPHPSIPLFPCVGLRTPGEKVRANFGQLPFVFDIQGYVQDVQHQLWEHLHRQPLPFSESQLHVSIARYLAFHRYEHTLRAFLPTAAAPPPEQATLALRQRIYAAVLQGHIQEIFPLIPHAVPSALLLECHIQVFLEKIAQGAPLDALVYGQTHFGPLSSHPLLPTVFGLLAYADPFRSPDAALLHPSRRHDLAEHLNAALLPQSPPLLERILKQAIAVGTELAHLGVADGCLVDIQRDLLNVAPHGDTAPGDSTVAGEQRWQRQENLTHHTA